MLATHMLLYKKTVLEIPSKDHPFDPSKDSVLKRVQKLFGDEVK